MITRNNARRRAVLDTHHTNDPPLPLRVRFWKRFAVLPLPGAAALTQAILAADVTHSAASQADSADEELRIVAAYARRKQTVPDGQYSRLNPAHLYMGQEIEREVLQLLQRFGCTALNGKRILEVGCGTGSWLRTFIQWGARPENLYGVDLLSERIEEAQHLLPPSVTLARTNAAHLDFPNEALDMVAQFCVFSSILSSNTKRQVAQEMVRVLRPGGHIVWYDFQFNNPKNPDVKGVNKGEVTRLFPNCRAHFRRVTVAPPLARLLVRVWPKLYPLAAAVKLLSTHYLALLQKTVPAPHCAVPASSILRCNHTDLTDRQDHTTG